ncbi:MAG: hypothetical protein Hyperionvirus16_24 [Hyperionvirus sp.]|uniref:Uncharacterized protein n=1 Tax=Hyperionvirus sp. TaxID=2487770 RepID=A0A3G5AF97_9VIRU|nr:MAG: hypothetical protein Hyperionvirus16_24 [Hyperionvirus sp.]
MGGEQSQSLPPPPRLVPPDPDCNYIVVSEPSKEVLQEKVNFYIAHRFVVIGNISVETYKDPLWDRQHFIFTQAMIKLTT